MRHGLSVLCVNKGKVKDVVEYGGRSAMIQLYSSTTVVDRAVAIRKQRDSIHNATGGEHVDRTGSARCVGLVSFA